MSKRVLALSLALALPAAIETEARTSVSTRGRHR
jgi:hypothetical protein